jgi:hypothetical protein
MRFQIVLPLPTREGSRGRGLISLSKATFPHLRILSGNASGDFRNVAEASKTFRETSAALRKRQKRFGRLPQRCGSVKNASGDFRSVAETSKTFQSPPLYKMDL